MFRIRHHLVAALLGVSAFCTLPALALEPASGKVMLTVGGKIGAKNTDQVAQFDMAMHGGHAAKDLHHTHPLGPAAHHILWLLAM